MDPKRLRRADEMARSAGRMRAKVPVEELVQRRMAVLELAKRLNNVTEACGRSGIDRTSFYVWRRRYQLRGLDGLKDLPPVAKRHPMTTRPEIVARIEELALEHPADGCNKIEAVLARENCRVSAITVQKILHALGLGTRRERRLALERRNAERTGPEAPANAESQDRTVKNGARLPTPLDPAQTKKVETAYNFRQRSEYLRYSPKEVSMEAFIQGLVHIKRRSHLFELLGSKHHAREISKDIENIRTYHGKNSAILEKEKIRDVLSFHDTRTYSKLTPSQTKDRNLQVIDAFLFLSDEVEQMAARAEEGNRDLIDARRIRSSLHFGPEGLSVEHVEHRPQDVVGLYASETPDPTGELANDLVEFWDENFSSRPPKPNDFLRFARRCCSAMGVTLPSRATLSRALQNKSK